MILPLFIHCIGGNYLREVCTRVIEIDAEASLYDLHEAIQDAFNFGRDHPFDFYLANTWSSHAFKKSFTEKEDWEDKENDFFRILLKDIWPTGRKKLHYLFDFGDEWTFEIRKARGVKKTGAWGRVPASDSSYRSHPEAISSI